MEEQVSVELPSVALHSWPRADILCWLFAMVLQTFLRLVFLVHSSPSTFGLWPLMTSARFPISLEQFVLPVQPSIDEKIRAAPGIMS